MFFPASYFPNISNETRSRLRTVKSRDWKRGEARDECSNRISFSWPSLSLFSSFALRFLGPLSLCFHLLLFVFLALSLSVFIFCSSFSQLLFPVYQSFYFVRFQCKRSNTSSLSLIDWNQKSGLFGRII